MKELTKAQMHRFAMRHLLRTLREAKSEEEGGVQRAFPWHPFDTDQKALQTAGETSYVIADPADPDKSVRSMTSLLGSLMEDQPVAVRQRFQLRIYRVRRAVGSIHPKRYLHRMYFEVAFDFGRMICCGGHDAKDNSVGSVAAQELEALFNFVAEFYDLVIEDRMIPLSRCKKVERLFRRTYKNSKSVKL